MEDTPDKVHWSFWLIAIIAVIWNGMGVMNYLAQMNPETLATYPQSHRDLIETQPIWSAAGFALAVFGGLLGGLLLLLKKSLAYYAFLVSLIGTVLVMLHTFTSGVTFSAFDITLIIAMPLIVAAFLTWYAKWAAAKGWTS